MKTGPYPHVDVMICKGNLWTKLFVIKFKLTEPEYFRHAGQANAQHEITKVRNKESVPPFLLPQTQSLSREISRLTTDR